MYIECVCFFLKVGFFVFCFCLFLFLFLRKGISVAALELTRLPGLELGNDLLVSAS